MLVVVCTVHSLIHSLSLSLSLVSLCHLRASFSAHIPDIDYFNDSIYMYSDDDAITPYTIHITHSYIMLYILFPFFLPFSSISSFFLRSFFSTSTSNVFHFYHFAHFLSFLFFFLFQTKILWLSAGDRKKHTHTNLLQMKNRQPCNMQMEVLQPMKILNQILDILSYQ